jgi:prepilin-type N-terminal cleavage/methylation domain-containing protein
MNTRRGFTLVEMLIVLVMLALVGAALTRILVNSMRVSAGQMVQADMQSNVRTGGLVMPLELREVGYDSNITTNVVTSDLELIDESYVQFRAGRGFSPTCGTPTLNEWRIRKPAYGMRAPALTDGFMLYVENDPNTGIDDQWIPMVVTAIDADGLCDGGPDSAFVLTTATPETSPAVDLALSQVFVGGPIKYYEVMRFGSFVDTDGQSYVGARSISAGEGAYRAVAGPIAAGTTGLRFLYYNRNATALNPVAANPVSVRAIEVQITGATRSAATLAGTLPRTTRSMFTRTRVALRNTLRH